MPAMAVYRPISVNGNRPTCYTFAFINGIWLIGRPYFE